MTPAEFTELQDKVSGATSGFRGILSSGMSWLGGSSVEEKTKEAVTETQEIKNLESYDFHGQAVDAITTIVTSDKFTEKDSAGNYTMTKDQFDAQSKDAITTVIKDHIEALPANEKFDLVQRLVVDTNLDIGRDNIRPIIAEYDSIENLASMPFYDEAVDAVTNIVTSRAFATMTEDQFKAQSTAAITEIVKDNIVAPDTYPELSNMMQTLGATDLAEKLDRTGDAFQNSLMYAINENPHFLPYIIDKATDTSAGASSNFLAETLDELFLEDTNGKPIKVNGEPDAHLMDAQKAQVVQNILTEIGNGDLYQNAADFDKLDAITRKSQAMAALPADASDAQKKAAEMDYYTALNLAGGNLPAFAGFDLKMGLEFIADIFDPNVGMDGAITNLTSKLKLDPASPQAEQLRQVGEIAGGFLTFVGGEPGTGSYGDLAHKASNGAYDHHIDGMKDMVQAVQDATGGRSVETTEQVLNRAATVSNIDDSFQADVQAGAGASPATIQDRFNILKENLPANAQDELAAIKRVIDQPALAARVDPTLTGTFGRMVTLSPEKFADAANGMAEDWAAGKPVLGSVKDAFTL